MMKFTLNPIWLNTFVTLIETGHFTHTAEKLFMTQPGVSQHLSKLEQACGHALIKRDKKSFEITEQGRLLYQYALNLADSEAALFEQLAFDDPHSGSCTLACSGSAALNLYPKLVALQRRYPALCIKVKAAPNQQIISEIKSGDIDQGIVTELPKNALLDAQLLGTEALCLVVPKSADISQSTPHLLHQLGLISHPDALQYLALYLAHSHDEALRQLDINTIPIVGAINQIGQILAPIAEGIGFTVIPKSALDNFPNAAKLTVLSPETSVYETLYLVKKKNRQLPARFTTVNAVIETAW